MKQSETVNVLKALADETRLGIVRKLVSTKKPVHGCDIVSSCVSMLRMSQPTMSHHFTKLVDAGILLEVKHGTQKAYQLNTGLLKTVGIDIRKL